MKSRLVACSLLLLAACSRPAPEAETAPSPAPTVTAALAEPVPTPAAEAIATPTTPPASTAALPALKDTEYKVVANGKPYKAVAGKIEVVEFFSYLCPACNTFEPLLRAWKNQLPADVNLVLIPADFREDFAIYARAYYAAELLGVAEKSHQAVYAAIHEKGQLPREGQTMDVKRIAAFYSQYGVTEKDFVAAMESFAVNTRMAQGRAFEEQSQLRSTPSLLVNGQYMAGGNSFEDKLRITSQLIEKVRQAP